MNLTEFIKKPKLIQAIRWRGPNHKTGPSENELTGLGVPFKRPSTWGRADQSHPYFLVIINKKGNLYCAVGDWIVKYGENDWGQIHHERLMQNYEYCEEVEPDPVEPDPSHVGEFTGNEL